MSAGLTPAQRQRLDAVADALIPASGEHLSASAADPRGFWLDRILGARPDLVAALAAIVDGLGDGDPEAALDELHAGDPGAYEQLLFVSHVRYFMNPRVRREVGYPGQVAAPQLPGEAETYLEEAGVDQVIARGPIYQRVPDGAGEPVTGEGA
ncbi:MAG: hypothetical protein JST31_03260 [Actinobacteria bacterium]|nr:hypothetical protein [Actinomycetota bacterium]